jgi:hypothetical protein
MFAVLVGTSLPLSMSLREFAQVCHDYRLGLWHPVNVYRWIKIALIVPLLGLIAPAGVFVMFGWGDEAMAVLILFGLALA